MSDMLRAPAEVKYAEELDWLESVDDGPKPFSWRLSPKMVRLFVLGSERADGLDREISQKWFGDRSFVERAIVTLAESLGMDTTAEGVETHDDLWLIRDLGVSQVQGYIFGKPMPAEELRTAKDARSRAPSRRFDRRGSR